jgi:hypothetical protein
LMCRTALLDPVAGEHQPSLSRPYPNASRTMPDAYARSLDESNW